MKPSKPPPRAGSGAKAIPRMQAVAPIEAVRECFAHQLLLCRREAPVMPLPCVWGMELSPLRQAFMWS